LIQKNQKIKAVKHELKKACFATIAATRYAQTPTIANYCNASLRSFLTFSFHYAGQCGDLGGGMIADNQINKI